MSTRPRRVIRAPAAEWAPTTSALPPPPPPPPPAPPAPSAPPAPRASRGSRGRGRGRATAANSRALAGRESSRPRRHALVKSYAELEDVEDEEEDEEAKGEAAEEEEERKGRGRADDGGHGSDTASDPLPDVDEDDETEYQRTHRLVMEPEMLPSGRPAVHHILAHRAIPAGWRTAGQSSSSAFHSSSSLSSPPAPSGLVSTAGVEEEHLSQMEPSVRVLVETSTLLMAHLHHHFFCTFKHMSFLHTAWLPLAALMEEGVKMKIKLSKYLRGDPLVLDGGEDEEEVREELIDSDFTCVDKVLAVREGRRREDIAGVRRFWPAEVQQKSKPAALLPLHSPHHHAQPAASSSAFDARAGREYLVKWSSLPYSASTWERPVDFCDSLKLDQFEQHQQLPTPTRLHSRRLHPTRPPPSAWQKLDEGVAYKGGNVLRPWQVEGVSWLLFNWYHAKGSILADEMGLGKTVQIVACLQHLQEVYCDGPFLVVVPLSTIQHWKREFELWTDMNVVLLQGSKHDRDMIVEYEWSFRDLQSGEERWKGEQVFKFTVCIATYESVLAEQALLSNTQWRCVAIDEAHRLKNSQSKLFKALQSMSAEHRILLTGTPIQNNMDELFTLLHYIEPKSFPSLSSFISDYGHLQKTEQVTALQQRLAPYLLRRMKEDVAKKLPKKEETIIEVELTLLQKQYYRAVLERNRQWLQRGVKGSTVPKLLNVVMQLRKVCSHPFLIEGAEEKEYEEIRARMEEEKAKLEQAAFDARVQAEQLKVLIGSSGKLTLCDKLLPRLQAEGHRVLIFSQMKLVLNLLEQYLELKGYEYERIDGNIRGNERQAAIDRFCRPGSSVFVFLLSTRAGGLGINLASADTVIIFDSDWNPQNDMQAQARAHRIGQTQQVKVYRLITSRTYEMEMFRRASLKLGLDQAVLRKMQVHEGQHVQYGQQQQDSSLTRLSQLDKKEVESLLKYGAYDLFNADADAASQKFCEEDIDQILQKRTTVVTQQPDGDEADDGDEDDEEVDEATRTRRLLKRKREANGGSTFSKANFTSSTSDSAVDLHASDFWERVIPDHKSAVKIKLRMDTRAIFADAAAREDFFADLFALVQEVIGQRQQGVEADNAAEVLELLMKMTEMGGAGEFSEEERLQASEWMQEIEKPKRQRRAMERWSDINNPQLAEANGSADPADGRLSAEWSRSGDGNKRRRMLKQSGGRQFTRRERKGMIHAVTTLAGLCPATPPPPRSASTLEPPIADLWQAIHSLSGLTDRSFEEFAAFSLAFLAYCSRSGDEEDSGVFLTARQRLITALPPPGMRLQVKEELKKAREEELDEPGMKDTAAAIDEQDDVLTSLPTDSPALLSSSLPLSLEGSSLSASFSPSRDLPPPTAVRSQTTSSTTSPVSSSAPFPPVAPVRSSSLTMASERVPRQGRSAASSRAVPASSQSLDPRTASSSDFPSMSTDKQFHKHVLKRAKKWSRYLSLQQLVQAELEQQLIDARAGTTKQVDGAVDTTADSDVDVSSDEEGQDEGDEESSDSDEDAAAVHAGKSAMTVRSRGRKWKIESMREQQRRVKEEGKKRKAAEERLRADATLQQRLQRRFGAFHSLAIPSKVDRSPAWWWTAADDKALIVGVSRHGTSFCHIETDPLLGFTRRLCEEPPSADGADYDPFVDGVRPLDPADGDALPAVAPTMTAAGSSGSSGSAASSSSAAIISCICNQPRYGRATKGSTRVCVRCLHFFHLDCLNKAREEGALRPESFPPMPLSGYEKAQQEEEGEGDDEVTAVKSEEAEKGEAVVELPTVDDEAAAESTVKAEPEEQAALKEEPAENAEGGAEDMSSGRSTRFHLQKRGQEPTALRGRGGRGRGRKAALASGRFSAPPDGEVPAVESEVTTASSAGKAVDDGAGEEDEDDDDEAKPSHAAGRSYVNGGWLCERCEMAFPSDRALELRLRSLLEAFDRDRRSVLLLVDRSERAKAVQREKRKKAEEVSTVWTKKERARFQRAVQMYGSSDTALHIMRKRMGLNKSEAVLRGHCERYLAQCRQLLAAARREQDVLTYAASKKELKVRGEELRQLKLRVERLVEREKELEQRKAERRKTKGGGGGVGGGGGGAEPDSDDEDLSGYCTCEGKVDETFMVCCDAQLSGCKEWYHGRCVGLTPDNLPTTWHCPHCARELHADTTTTSEREKEKDRRKDKEKTRAEPEEKERDTRLLPSLQVHPPSPMSAHVLSSQSLSAPASAPPSAPVSSASVHSTFSYPPQQAAFDPPGNAHPYLAQSYPTFQQHLQHPQHAELQQYHSHYQQQQQHQQLQLQPSPLYGAPGGYSLVGLSHPSGPVQYTTTTTYMLPPHYPHPMQAMSGQPTPVYINGQPVLMQSMPSMDLQSMQAVSMGYYQQPYQPTYLQQQQQPSMQLYQSYAPMQVQAPSSLHPHQPMHPQPQSAFAPTLATSMPLAPVVPLGAQPSPPAPVQPLQPLAAPVQPLAPPPEAAQAISPAPPVLPLAPATSKPPSPLAPAISGPARAAAYSAVQGSSSKSAGSKSTRRSEDSSRVSTSPALSKPSPVKPRSPPPPPPPPPSFSQPHVDASPSPPAAGGSDDAPRAAAWKVRRQLYSTSAAAMALQMNKLLAEQHKEQLKLAEWKRQRIDLTDTTTKAPSTSSTPQSSSILASTADGEDRISLHLAHKVLTRVLLLDYLRATSQRLSDAELKEKLRGAPVQLMPAWWQPSVHDWSCIRGVLDHGLGMIDDILADPALTPAWSAAVQAEKAEKRDGRAFLATFLRDKGPLLRRLHVACNWVVLQSTRNPSEEWLEWLLTSKRELKSTAFRVNQNVSAYNATSSHTLAALSQATANTTEDDQAEASSRADRSGSGSGSGALLSIQSISNWARIKENALKLQPATAAAVSSGRVKREEESSNSIEADRRRDDARKSRSSPSKRSRGRSSYSSPSSSSADDSLDDDALRRRRKRQRKDKRGGAGGRSSRSRPLDRRSSDPARRAKRPRSSRRSASSASGSLRVEARPKTLPKVAPRDAQNRPILPLPIKGGISITSLGHIVSDRPLYHTSNTIYPVGFTSQRQYYSLKHPTQRVQWTSRIDDGGKSPLFVVTPADDQSASIINRTASGAWGEVIKKVHRLKGKGHLKVTQSGPMIFGVANSMVKQLVNEMEGADVIHKRWEKEKEEGKTESAGEDEEGEEVEEEDEEEREGEGLAGREEEKGLGGERGEGKGGRVERAKARSTAMERGDEVDDAEDEVGSSEEGSSSDSDNRSSSGSDDDSDSDDSSDSLSGSSDDERGARGKRRREPHPSGHHHDERARRDGGKRKRRR